MTTQSEVTGYITAVRGLDVTSPAAVEFRIVDTRHAQDPQWAGPYFSFSLTEVAQSRQLIWVALLRDALVHTLPVKVGYCYDQQHDPGTGTVTYIETATDPFDIDPQANEYWVRKTATGTVASVSVEQFKAWYGPQVSSGIPGRATVELQLDSGGGATVVLELATTDHGVHRDQLQTLLHAQAHELSVTITYSEPGAPVDVPGYMLAVAVHSPHRP